MLTRDQYQKIRQKTIEYFDKANIVITDEEKDKIEVADFDLNRQHEIGLQLLVYINTDRVCAKEMVLFPGQICPEHKHPTVDGVPGKEETFRCRWGKVYLYLPGEKMGDIKAKIPEGYSQYLTCFKEIELNPGEQCTIMPDTFHWFQAGPEGAIISEFSTKSTDETDVFTDKRIDRIPKIEE
ncbi:MAG: D-lyxose/D-mannose family sugar isomerase [Clostridia bacterium]|nr:D-lyxose/D-mannose family sugar isomerase [Clostridia bacterium]